MFQLKTNYSPAGDQAQAIAKLVDGIKKGDRAQTLLGVTGSRKNIYHGQHYSAGSKTNSYFST